MYLGIYRNKSHFSYLLPQFKPIKTTLIVWKRSKNRGSWLLDLERISFYSTVFSFERAVTSKNKTFITILAAKSLIITFDTCDTLEWIIVVTVFRYVVSGEASGAFFVMPKPPLHCHAKQFTQTPSSKWFIWNV